MTSIDAVKAAAAGTANGRREVDLAAKLINSTDTQTSATGQDGFYRPKPIKRNRRKRVEVNRIKQEIISLLEADNPQTVRQVYYALTVRGLIGKTETEYKQTVVRLLTDMRERGEVPFEWIADNTRLMRKPSTFSNLEAFLKNCHQNYRRNLWVAAPVYIEIWCEKDALTGVIFEETEPYDVPLMVARGYSSITFVHSAAKAIEAREKPAYIYHLGDYDPSGQDAARDIEEKLRRYSHKAEIHFQRLAVTPEQIEKWNLPTRPNKASDSRTAKFKGAASVELDAIPAKLLRQLVRETIERHIDKRELEITRVAEASERDQLREVARIFKGQSPKGADAR
jgi:hypothetical protein